MSNMTPREIAHELDKHIIGQDAAKRAVAIALRNRWRRLQLSEELRNQIAAAGYPRLFRHILPPSVTNIGFIGYASSFACQLTAEVGAHWLSEQFLGNLKLPSVDEMNEEIDLAHSWANLNLPNRGTEGFVGPYISNYVDDLIVDMGLNTRRTGSIVREYLTVFRASRFAGLADERRRSQDAVAP